MDDEAGKKKSAADSNECVSVVVRCRPMNTKEKNENRSSIIDIDVAARQVSIKNPADQDFKSFTYDGAYDETTQQRVFYEESCFGIIESVLEGFNGTIFAYGQTGCGKSFTMQGPTQNPTAEMRGVIPNSFSHIFECVKASTDVEYLIRCSYLEIYNEEVKDLLGNQKTQAKCELKEDPQKGVFVKGLTDVVVETEDQLMAMLDKGLSVRTTASTQMNAESSRSHSIFSVVVEMSTKDLASGKDMIRAGKLNLVDLAGSERQKKTGATGNLLKEGAKINLSLSALGNVISALSEGSKGKHIPYRDSKLTRLLQDSLGGNTKTLMVAAISPADYNFDETMSTLRYANRAKNIKNKPKINEDPKDTMLREFKEEIERLRKMLSNQADGVSLGAAGVVARPKKVKAEGVLDENDDEEEEEEEEEVIIVKKEKIKKPKKTRTVFVEGDEVGGDEDVLSPTLSDQLSGKSEEKKENLLEYSYERKGMEEFSQAVVEERDLVNEKLKMKESEVEQERILRMELCDRLKELQNKFVGHNDQAPGASGAAAANPASIAEEAEREAAKKHMKERRSKAKKKREIKQQEELNIAVMEKQAMEEELEELRLSAVVAGEEKVNELLERRVLKIKKKYEKKITNLRADLIEAAEEFEYQRQIMLDSLKEQEKDTSLYETVCRSLLTDREFRRMIDKSKWLEEEEEWLVPSLRMKSVDCSSSSGFPGIHSSSVSNNNSHANILSLAGTFSSILGGSPRSSVESSSNFPMKKRALSPRNSGPIPPQSQNGKQSLLLSLPVGVSTSVSLPNLPSARTRDKSPCGDVSNRSPAGEDYSQMTARGINRMKSCDQLGRPLSKNYGSLDNPSGTCAGEDRDSLGTASDDFQQQMGKKAKKRSKKKKAAKAAGFIGRHGSGDGSGTGAGAGQVDEWGFAVEGVHKEPEYSDDEDFEGDDDIEDRDRTDTKGHSYSNGHGNGHGNGNSNSNGQGNYGGGIGYGNKKSMPAVDHQHKVKSGGVGLPQIR